MNDFQPYQSSLNPADPRRIGTIRLAFVYLDSLVLVTADLRPEQRVHDSTHFLHLHACTGLLPA